MYPNWTGMKPPPPPVVGPPCKVQVFGLTRDGVEDWVYCNTPTPLTGAVTVLEHPVCDGCASVIR